MYHVQAFGPIAEFQFHVRAARDEPGDVAPMRILEEKLLSDDWATLTRYTIDYRRRDGVHETLLRQVYDRGNGACILPYDPERGTQAIRALYDTGFFRDVELCRDGSTLVVAVLERPSIESFELKGNKDIKTEDLNKSLRNVGLATCKTFDRSVLEDVKQFLTDQYFSRGKYAVRIKTSVEDVPGNRVKVKIDIKEGKRARILQINVVGNTSFTDEDILEGFELKTPNWLSWYKQDDRYAR